MLDLEFKSAHAASLFTGEWHRICCYSPWNFQRRVAALFSIHCQGFMRSFLTSREFSDYRKMYEAGYLIASSLVEKAADLVVAKRQKKKQGMHWTRMGADRLSALRTLWLNGDWQDYWRERRQKAA